MKRPQEIIPPPPPPALYGDILDSILTHVPTVDLLPASHVSSTWRLAVSSFLRRFPRPAPWLLLHLLPRRHPNRIITLAYDPYSRSWIPLPSFYTGLAPLRCSSTPPSFLFSLSPAQLSLSSHPLSATWTHTQPPSADRSEPLVALVGPTLVVAGGVHSFQQLPGAVELLDTAAPSPSWTFCDPMPPDFLRSGSSSATFLSAATSDDSLYILDKNSGLFAALRPDTGTWSRTCYLNPDPLTHDCTYAIGFSDGKLILVGLSGSDHPESSEEDPMMMRMSLTAWEVDVDLGSDSDHDPDPRFKEIGRMPRAMVEALAGSGFGWTTIGFGLVGGFGYLYNPEDFEPGAVLWEVSKGRWERVERPNQVDEDPTARIVFGCAKVGLEDLKDVFMTRK